MRIALALLVACGGSSQPPVSSPPATPAPPPKDPTVEQEQAHKAELAAAHRARLDEQATALAATCDKPPPSAPRCEPSCYTAEPPDPRAGKKSPRPVEIVHVVCARGDEGPYILVDELAGTDVRAAPSRSRVAKDRVPKPAKAGTWQAEIEAAATTALQPELARGDAVRVLGTWRHVTHPHSHERLRCVSVAHFARALKPLDACGAHGKIACEASRDHAAHGINVVHARMFEAQQLQSQGKPEDCQRAALEAVAVARGMPRWRQYMALNTSQWKPAPRFRTRFDGVLDEDTLFATAIALGVEAERLYVACGGAANPVTTAQQEQSFHGCW
jgi:hypothetical protein